jgi:hypothetical protein
MSFKHENKCPAYTCTGRVHHGREFRLGQSRSDRATCWGFSLGGDCSSAAERDHGSVVLSPAINRCGSSLCVDSQHRGGGVSWRPQAKGRRGAALGPGHSLGLPEKGSEELSVTLSARLGDLVLTDKEVSGIVIKDVGSVPIPKPKWVAVGKHVRQGRSSCTPRI